jgi:autotransporter-associated beta strand protein
MADRIREVAAAHPEAGPGKAPYFLTCNVRFSPTFYKQVIDLLNPPNQASPYQFKLVGMPDFLGLAHEAGAFTVVPYAEGVGAGDTLQVALTLRKPVETPANYGNAGTVSWTLPDGWTSVPASWNHDAVAAGTTATQIVTLIPPSTLTNGTVNITFRDDRVSWTRSLVVKTYQGGTTVTNGAATTGWTPSAGAAVQMENGMVKVRPSQELRRSDYTRRGDTQVDNGRVSLPLGKVDLSRQPFLEINIPDQDSGDTRIGVASSTANFFVNDVPKGTFMSSLGVLGTTGVQDLTLTIDPARRHGRYVAVRAVKVHYKLPATAPLVVNSGTMNLGTSKNAVINAGILNASPSIGSTSLDSLHMGGNGNLSLGANFTLPLYLLSGPGNLTINGTGAWGQGVRLVDGNPNFTGKIVLDNAWLWATDASLGAVPAIPVADALSLKGSLVLTGPLSANRGITITGASQIFGSSTTLNNRITGPYGLQVRSSTIVLANNTNDFTGDYATWTVTTTMGVDNALPYGIGKGTLRFTDWDGSGSTVDLNGRTLTVNAITQSAIQANSNIDNKAVGAATLVVGDNANTGLFGGVIKNTGGPLSLTKVGSRTQTLTNICTYTGPTLVNGGTLALTGAGSISNSATITLAAGATLDVTSRVGASLTLSGAQTLTGSGTVKGGLLQEGTLSPGNGTARLAISGNYSQASTGVLDVKLLSANACDQVAVSGAASLGGTLNVTIPNGYIPRVNDQFVLLTAGSVAGDFATTRLPALTRGLSWTITKEATSVKLGVSGRPAPDTYATYAAYYGLGAGNVDPDRYGLKNLMLYAMGKVPGNKPTPPAQLRAAASGLTFAFDRNADTTRLNYYVETASKPAGPWTIIASKIGGGAWTGSASVSETEVRPGVVENTVSNIDQSEDVGFLHLRVESPPEP